MLFHEKDFSDTYKFFASRGMHQQQNLVFKKQEMLMNIMNALLEAANALYKDDRVNPEYLVPTVRGIDFNMIIGTYEDKLAQAIILCYDYAGCWRLKNHTITLGYEAIMNRREKGYSQSLKEVKESYEKEKFDNSPENIKNPKAYCLSIIKCLTDTYYGSFAGNDIGSAIAKIHILAESTGVDLRWHVNEHMNYLKTK